MQPGLKLRTGEVSRRIRRGTEHHRLVGDAPARGRRLPGGHAGIQRGGTVGGRPPGARRAASPSSAPSSATAATPTAGTQSSPAARSRAAVARGAIAPDRWQSYLVLLEELETAAAQPGSERRAPGPPLARLLLRDQQRDSPVLGSAFLGGSCPLSGELIRSPPPRGDRARFHSAISSFRTLSARACESRRLAAASPVLSV